MPDTERQNLQKHLRATETVALSFSARGTVANASETPLVLVHGLFGSSRNWQSIAAELEANRAVYSIDQRNHGSSPHHPSHTIYDMVADLHRWSSEHLKSPAIFLGHSMGGLATMGLALAFPEMVNKLIVVDIAPRDYSPHHGKEFEALKMDVSSFRSRSEIDAAMASIHDDPGVRKFLQMNLERTSNGYRWILNVDALASADYLQGFDTIFEGLTYSKPTLAIKGEKSNYIQSEDRQVFDRYFPELRFVELKNADHWMHYSAQEAFLGTIKPFIAG